MKKVKDVIMDQPKLGINVFAGSIMVLTAVVWMALDIYLPALPILKEEFKVSATYLNLTLTAGIIATAIGTLIGGPMSDKYGRKPVFASGVGLSLLFTFLCTFAGSVDFLIVVRGLASLGNGIILTVTTAMIKDTFSGRTFKNVMTVLQSAAIIGPILAPSVGSVIITWLSWRWLFVFIAVVSVVPAALILFARETWPEGKRISDSALKAVSDTLHTAGDKPFALFAGVMAVLTIPMWAYISVCSYIYITDFGISNMQYGIFYALGAGVSCISPFLYMVITRHSSTGRACEVCLGLILLSGVMLIAVGGRAPVLFLLSTLPFIIAEGMNGSSAGAVFSCRGRCQRNDQFYPEYRRYCGGISRDSELEQLHNGACSDLYRMYGCGAAFVDRHYTERNYGRAPVRTVRKIGAERITNRVLCRFCDLRKRFSGCKEFVIIRPYTK